MRRKFRSMLILSAAFFVLCGMTVPTEVKQQDIAEDKRILIRVYNLKAGEDPEVLKEEPFTLDGYTYEYQSIVQDQEKETRYVKAVSKQAEIETESGEWEDIIPQIDSRMEYSENGYEGTLILDTASIHTEVKEYKTSSYTVSDTRTYTDLAYNDPALVPQTVTKNGMTLSLKGISWAAQGGSGEAGTLFPTSYTATASYSAVASSKKAAGYVTTATYSGEVSKTEDMEITYTVTYLGTPVESEENSLAIPIITVVAILFALGAGGALVFLYIKQKRKGNSV